MPRKLMAFRYADCQFEYIIGRVGQNSESHWSLGDCRFFVLMKESSVAEPRLVIRRLANYIGVACIHGHAGSN